MHWGERSIVEEPMGENVDIRLGMRMGNGRPFISMTGFRTLGRHPVARFRIAI